MSAQRPSGYSFPRSLRLRKHAEFDRVYREGRRVTQPDLFAMYLRGQQRGARVGFTVGRVIGNAVERNRLRRRLREAVRLAIPRADQLTGVDIVVQPRKSALDADFARLQQQIAEVFRAVQQDRGAAPRPRSPRQSNSRESRS